MMMGRKILTLACAVGILACGACFLPPLPAPKPAPPPVNLDLHGMRSIGVEVNDSSATPHLETGRLAREIASQISERGRRDKLQGAAGADIANLDGELKVSLRSEDVVVHPATSDSAYPSLEFHIVVAAVLTRKDGTVIWSRPNLDYFFRRGSPLTGPDLWRDSTIAIYMNDTVSSRLVNDMLMGR